MSAALAISLPGIRWFSRGETLSIVKATFPAVLLDTGIAGTTPSQRLLISTTLSSSGLRFLFAITASTFTPLWLVIGPSLESATSHFLDQTKNNQEGCFQVLWSIPIALASIYKSGERLWTLIG